MEQCIPVEFFEPRMVFDILGGDVAESLVGLLGQQALHQVLQLGRHLDGVRVTLERSGVL